MGYKPVIRRDDRDTAGDKSINTQSNFLVDEQGNLKLNGSIDGSGSGSGGGIAFSNAVFTGVVKVIGNSSVIMQGGNIKATQGGGKVEVNPGAGNVQHANSSGGFVDVNTGGDSKVYINSPQGSAVNCLASLAQADADADGSSVDMSNGYPTDGAGEFYGSNVASAGDMGGYSDCIPSGDYDLPPGQNPIVGMDGNDVPNKIVDHAIPVNNETGEINKQLQLGVGTEENPAPPTVQWRMDNAPPGVTIDERTGKIRGNMEKGDYKTIVTATDATTGVDLDSKTYNLRRVEPNKSEMIQLQAPLPQGTRISSRFGPRNVKNCSKCSKNHKGIDYAAPSGTPIGAAGPGKVTFAGKKGGYGNTVIVSHYNQNGTKVAETLYAHMSSVNVKQGQAIPQGGMIGKVGSTGVSTGPHLHYETRLKNKNGGFTQRDPLAVMNGKHMVSSGVDGLDPSAMVNNSGIYVDGMGSCGSSVPGGDCGGGFGDPTADVVNTIPADVPVSFTIKEPEDENFISRADVIEIMNDVFDRHPELDNEDRSYLFFVARTESSFDPWAQDPISSKQGLFKMADAVAAAYPHERNDVESSTEAMIQFYLKEEKRYWDYFIESYGTKLSKHLIIEPRAAEHYKTYSKLEFIYGLIHHDGVISAAQGISQGGVAYVQRLMKSFPKILH